MEQIGNKNEYDTNQSSKKSKINLCGCSPIIDRLFDDWKNEKINSKNEIDKICDEICWGHSQHDRENKFICILCKNTFSTLQKLQIHCVKKNTKYDVLVNQKNEKTIP